MSVFKQFQYKISHENIVGSGYNLLENRSHKVQYTPNNWIFLHLLVWMTHKYRLTHTTGIYLISHRHL